MPYQIAHWFDGLAHTHRFDIIPRAGWQPDQPYGHARVLYSSRRQSDLLIKHLCKNPTNTGLITFAQRDDPCIGVFAKFMSSWALATNTRVTKRLENLAVTVQVNVPGFNPDHDVPVNGCPIPRKDKPTVWLASDTNTMRQVDAKTLKPIGVARQVTVHPALTGPLSCAHAQRCPKTGDWFNFNLTTGPMPTYRVFRVSAADNTTEILATISKPDLKITYVHSFFLSKRFVVLRLPSSTIGAYGLSILWNKNLLDAIEPFDESRKCKWFVIDRLHGQGVVAEFETPAAFFFHTVNCFDELVVPDGSGGGNDEGMEMADIYCDVVDYPTTDILYTLYYDVLLNRDNKAKAMWSDEEKARRCMPSLVRWKLRVPVPCAPPVEDDPQEEDENSAPEIQHTLSSWGVLSAFSSIRTTLASFTHGSEPTPPSLPSPSIVLTIPAPHAGDLPTINSAFHTRPARYVYSLANSGRSTIVDTIVKTDVLTREATSWNNPLGHTPGEAIFVAKPGSEEEDDGVLLSVVLDGKMATSYLLCLDALTMKEVGSADMDFAVGVGFHGVHTTGRIGGHGAGSLPWLATREQERSDFDFDE